ncbi:MAG: CHAT domain-containing protein [Thermoanaerobaculia bacterium]
MAALYLLPAGCAPVQVRTPLQDPVRERTIRGGEIQSTALEVRAGELLRLVVEQDRVDVVVKLFDPEGRQIAAADGPDYWMWEEEIALVAETSGPYRLEVQPFLKDAAPGVYRVRVDGPRAPRDADRTRIEALRELSAAHAIPQGTVERLRHLESAVRIWRSLGDRRREAEALYQVTETLARLGRPAEAAAPFRQTVGLWQELGLPAQLAWTLLESSRVERRFFQGEEARRNLEEALKLAVQAGSAFLEVRTLQALGRFHEREPRTAAPYLERAIRLAREHGYRDMEMRCLYQLGFTLDNLAEKQEALHHYEQALELSRELGDVGQEANAHNSIGHLYVSLGDLDKAVEHLEQALALNRNAKDRQHEAAALNNLALVYERLDPPKARRLYDSALALGRETGNREIQAKAIGNLALLDLEAGQAGSALERSRDALGLTEGDTGAESHLRFVMGKAYRRLGDLESSRRELEAALRLARERGDRVDEAKVIAQLARTERQAGDLPRALAHLREGIRLLESIRAEVVEEKLRATFLASRQDTYKLLIDTLMALHEEQPDRGHDAEALQVSELARARTLLDILSQAGADVREGADPGLVDRERRLLADIEGLERSRLDLLAKGVGSPEVRDATARLDAALEEHRRVEADLRVSSPRYAALTQPRPADLAEIQGEVLDGRALLLEYSLGEERSYLWAVTPTALRSFELPPRARIEEAARRWYGALVVHPQDERYPKAAEEARKAADELAAMLLGPVEGLLAGQPLLVVGDGALQYLPFGALPVPTPPDTAGRAPLIVRHEVVSLPSASALAVLRRELAGRSPAPKTLAVLADPVFRLEDSRVIRSGRRGQQEEQEEIPGDLRTSERTSERASEIDPRQLPRLFFSQREAEAIAKLVPEPQRFTALGFAATRSVATGGELASYRMIHFATHGLIDSRRPELSSLVLSLVNEQGEPQNGFLRLHDIYNLELRADLVVLSACQTALGQEIRGEGLVGLTRGFMYAGAARVLASLWSVDDRATSVLMERFYGHMISGRLSPAEALRQAQIDMSRDPRWRSPYYWAGFSLQGEWR